VLLTDTTMRDAHQSLLATRMRSDRHAADRPAYARDAAAAVLARVLGRRDLRRGHALPEGGSLGAAARLRAGVPNILLQMLLRGSNAVGYTNYPDNVVKFFVQQAAAAGVDVFRVFDSLNWVENMRVAIDAVNEAGGLCEARSATPATCSARSRSKYDLRYYVGMAPASCSAAGAQVIGIKDMSGVCQAARGALLVARSSEEIGLPIHFHTHDTSGLGAPRCWRPSRRAPMRSTARWMR
jgi:pyruvate carboxylase